MDNNTGKRQIFKLNCQQKIGKEIFSSIFDSICQPKIIVVMLISVKRSVVCCAFAVVFLSNHKFFLENVIGTQHNCQLLIKQVLNSVGVVVLIIDRLLAGKHVAGLKGSVLALC